MFLDRPKAAAAAAGGIVGDMGVGFGRLRHLRAMILRLRVSRCILILDLDTVAQRRLKRALRMILEQGVRLLRHKVYRFTPHISISMHIYIYSWN